MIVSTILLTKDNFYVDEFNNLPKRPEFDKKLLTAIVKGQYISNDAEEMLPPSIRQLALSAEGDFKEPTVGVTIPEIDGLTDLLIIVRSTEIILRGKQFRLDNFEPIVKDKWIELWKRK